MSRQIPRVTHVDLTNLIYLVAWHSVERQSLTSELPLSCARPTADGCRGGATVLKAGGGAILRAEREKKNFLTPPLFGQWGGQNIA